MQSENDEIGRIKREISVFSLAERSGIKLKKISADEYAGLCIFHKDKNPSLHVNPVKNTFHCKGCGKGGSVIDWIKHEKNCSTHEAIVFLKSQLSSTSPAFTPPASERVEVNLRRPELQQALRIAVDYYHKTLKEQQAPIEYLMKRGLRFGELVEDFKIGYADGTLLEKLTPEITPLLLEIGILRKNGTLVERFKGALIFPVMDENGIITEIYARAILPGAEKHQYLPGVHRGIFNSRALIAKEIIITESVIDALSLMTLGYRNVIAAYGAQGFTEEMKERLSAAGTERLYVAFDADNAGNRGAEKIVEKLRGTEIQVYRVQFPDGFDPNEFIRKVENAAAIFKDLIINSSLISLAEEAKTEATAPRDWEKKGSEYHFTFGERLYIARGLEKNADDTTLKTLLRASLGEKFHIDNLDLFHAKSCWGFVKSTSERLGLDDKVIRADLDKITTTLEPELKIVLRKETALEIASKYRVNLLVQQKAEKALREPDYLIHFLREVEECALVGENLNVLFGLASTITRKCRDQIHIIIQSESSSGKSTLLNLLADFVPDEDKLYFTQITPKSFYHAEEGSMKNKSIFVVEMQGLAEAQYPIQQMMSEKKLVNIYTMTDPKTGKFVNETRLVEGPDQFTITCPTENISDDINNRSAILSMMQNKDQLEKVMQFQRRLLSGEGVKLRKRRFDLVELAQHIQRALTITRTVNPHMAHLHFGAETNRSLRDHQRYLNVIEAITILFQKQREIVTIDGEPHIRTHVIDIAIGNFLCQRVFGRSLTVLPPQTNSFVSKIAQHYLSYAKEKKIEFTQIWFYRRDMQEIMKLSMNRVHEHTNRAVMAEYFTTRRDQNGIAYRFLFEPAANGSFTQLLQLANMAELLRKCSKKEREEYQTYKPVLDELFNLLDPTWAKEQI
ncbi:CHC2 zinc finger domain-containing protein [Turneriella parva]|uniref:TOPRIM domain-containing protein n=1 Tax=Turneriella parva (strain ATCC BAA-1111 / DSM 21527 / NCTC 11395 / H) TaxID=869212 RepID=I4B830_TURPD|nr:CHC2 zinc finger domain-containing protein [Turneriella parva]AFM13437.1 TOPRIM domain-containing protein [Turneriella parva DSM 21527]